MKNEIAVFGGGCFWCTEAVFKMLKGVSEVLPGYSGGRTKNPTYAEVSMGDSGHAECTQVTFDPKEISYKDLLTVFFGSHDPTTVNRQGKDVGEQYRSVIFYTTPKQKKTAEDFIKEINRSNKGGEKVVTEVVPLEAFYPAENYHQDYFERNKSEAYCEVVINPKLEKVIQKFGELLKNNTGKL
ncbi:MAG: peptide-methionine (S)-S-oxide reductase [Parcubacteria group bacterium Gr01-1014_46]|nr:MAG: peptide-methionine (S)-S-oxide reductase [Parcubacteria group bacterium Gr01-1014_46]